MSPMQTRSSNKRTRRFVGTADSIGTENIVGSQEGEAAAQQVQLSAPGPAQPQLSAPTGGQSGSQQATQGQMANTGTSTGTSRDTKFTPDLEKYRRVMIFLRVYKCLLLETHFQLRRARGRAEVFGSVIIFILSMVDSFLKRLRDNVLLLSQTQTALGRFVAFAEQRAVASNVSVPLNSDPSIVRVAGNQTVSTIGFTVAESVATAFDIQIILNKLENLLLRDLLGQFTAIPVQGTNQSDLFHELLALAWHNFRLMHSQTKTLERANLELAQSQTQTASRQSVAEQQVVAPNVSFPSNSTSSIAGVAGNLSNDVEEERNTATVAAATHAEEFGLYLPD